MNILAKSAPYYENIKCKLAICNTIELQLLEHFTRNNYYSSSQVTDILNVLKKIPEAVVYNVHTPITGIYECKIDYTQSVINMWDLEMTVTLAEEIAQLQGHVVSVIVHCELSELEFDDNKKHINDIVNNVLRLLKTFPDVNIYIENVTPFYKLGDKGIVFRNGNYFENCHLVDRIYSSCNESDSSRVKTVLDICHAKTVIAIEKMLKKESGLQDYKVISLDDYFLENVPYIGLIHLNDVKNLGVVPNEHGTVPSDDDLRIFVDLYKKYNYNCDVTLEVNEENYLICDNFKSLYPRVVESLGN